MRFLLGMLGVEHDDSREEGGVGWRKDKREGGAEYLLQHKGCSVLLHRLQ